MHEILHISAVYGDEQFDVYCLPTRPISSGATQTNHLTFDGETLYHRDQPVDAVSLRRGVRRFVRFLESLDCSERLILVGHNVQFDRKFIIRALQDLEYLDRTRLTVEGFLCTLLLFRRGYPGLPSYTQF